MKETKLYVAVATLSAGDNHIGMNIKQKVIIKTRQMNLDILSNQVLLESIDYFLQFMQKRLKDFMLEENITYKKVKKYNVIIIVKRFHDQTIGSDIKNMKN